MRLRTRPEGARPSLSSVESYPRLIPTSRASQFCERCRLASRSRTACTLSSTMVRPRRAMASREAPLLTLVLRMAVLYAYIVSYV